MPRNENGWTCFHCKRSGAKSDWRWDILPRNHWFVAKVGISNSTITWACYLCLREMGLEW